MNFYTSLRRAAPSFLSRCKEVHGIRPQIKALYGSVSALTKQEIETRVLSVLQGFDKIKAEKVVSFANKQLTPTAQFNADLGLDSLDVVEVVMAIEEEFFMEIPDQVADNIRTAADAVDFIFAEKNK